MAVRGFQAAYSDDEGSSGEEAYNSASADKSYRAPRDGSDSDEDLGVRDEDEEEEEDEPGTGFAQFVDSDDDDGISGSGSDESESPLPRQRAQRATGEGQGISQGKRKRRASDSDDDSDHGDDDDEEDALKQGLASIPFGELLKAQQSLSGTGAQKSSKSKDRSKGRNKSNGFGSDSAVSGCRRGKEAAHQEQKKKRTARELAARRDKNAPTEESSVRPVSRRRAVVEVRKVDRRDPRFSALSGQAKKNEFNAQYSFLKDVYSAEIKGLRERFVTLQKKERGAHGAAADVLARERESVGRELDRALALAAERRRRSEADAVDAEQRRVNRQRLAEGKKAFYLKDSDKKKLVLQKRYERLAGAEAGGQGATENGSSSKQLRKALERRRKRNAAKERKALPFVADPRRAGHKPKRS